ncbi:unnamed protein product, partial [marine sediment metagenome]
KLNNQDKIRIWLVFFNDTSMWQVLLSQLGEYKPELNLPEWTQNLSGAKFELVKMKEFPGRKYMSVYLFEQIDP